MSNESKRQKPNCPLIGEDGNIFNLVGIAAKTLKRNGLSAEATEMSEKVFGSGSYEEALGIIGEYVNITSVDELCEDIDLKMGERRYQNDNFDDCECLKKLNEKILESLPEQQQSGSPEMSM